MNARTFTRIQRTHEHGAFGAIEYAFEQIQNVPNVTPVIIYVARHEYEFYVNDHNRTAVYKKCVMRVGNY